MCKDPETHRHTKEEKKRTSAESVGGDIHCPVLVGSEIILCKKKREREMSTMVRNAMVTTTAALQPKKRQGRGRLTGCPCWVTTDLSFVVLSLVNDVHLLVVAEEELLSRNTTLPNDFKSAWASSSMARLLCPNDGWSSADGCEEEWNEH